MDQEPENLSLLRLRLALNRTRKQDQEGLSPPASSQTRVSPKRASPRRKTPPRNLNETLNAVIDNPFDPTPNFPSMVPLFQRIARARALSPTLSRGLHSKADSTLTDISNSTTASPGTGTRLLSPSKHTQHGRKGLPGRHIRSPEKVSITPVRGSPSANQPSGLYLSQKHEQRSPVAATSASDVSRSSSSPYKSPAATRESFTPRADAAASMLQQLPTSSTTIKSPQRVYHRRSPPRIQQQQQQQSTLELAAACNVQRMSFLLQTVVRQQQQQRSPSAYAAMATAEALREENEKGETALIIAARKGAEQMVALLLGYGSAPGKVKVK